MGTVPLPLAQPAAALNFDFQRIQGPAPAAQVIHPQGPLGIYMWQNGEYRLVKEISDAEDNVKFAGFETAVATYLLGKNVQGQVKWANIDYANGANGKGTIIYELERPDGKIIQNTILISEASKDPVLKTEIDKVKAVVERIWGGSIREGTIGPEKRQYALSSKTNEFLGKMNEDDVLLRDVAKPQFYTRDLDTGEPTAVLDVPKLNECLQAVATAKQLKKKFKEKIVRKKADLKEEVRRLKTDLAGSQEQEKQIQRQLIGLLNNNDDPGHRQALQRQLLAQGRTRESQQQLLLLQDQLNEVGKIYAELNDGMDETTLTLLLAYRSQQKGWLDAEVGQNRGPAAYKQVADALQANVDAVYTREYQDKVTDSWSNWFKNKKPFSSHEDPKNIAPGRDMASAFIKAGSDVNLEASLSNGQAYDRQHTGTIKGTRFVDAFNHFVFQKTANLRGDDATNYNRAVAYFNTFLDNRFGADTIRNCHLDPVSAGVNNRGSIKAIAKETQRLQTVISPPLPPAPPTPAAINENWMF